MDKIIYLDNAATTKINPLIEESIKEVFHNYYGNSSSIHSFGQNSNRLINKCRDTILNVLHLNNHEVIFTSGATEANNLAIKGSLFQYSNRGKHIITSSIEHPSVLESVNQLVDKFGYEVSLVNPDSNGVINIEDIVSLIRPDTILVSVMAVNNEVGSINNIKEIANILKKYPKIIFHVDATQAIGKINIDYSDVDLISFTAHKFHGPKGVGCLIKRKGLTLLPLFSGGGQESNLRSGTSNLEGILGLTKALKFEINDLSKHFQYVESIAKPIYEYLNNHQDIYEIHSNIFNPYIINFSLRNKKAAVVVESLSSQGIMISSTSACHSKKETGSYVVLNMKKDINLSKNTLRISLSYNNTIEEINTFINVLDKTVKEIR